MVEISEIFPLLLKPAYYNILWLPVSKFLFLFFACTKNGSLGAFLAQT